MYCKHCGKEIADDSNFCQHCGGEQDIILSKQSDNSEQDTITKAEVQQSNDEDKQSDNTIGRQRAKKKTSYFTLFFIIAAILFSTFVIRPMVKFYKKQRAIHKVEASGVLGAGLDRAEPIVNKIKKEFPFSLEMLGDIEKVYFGTGTIIMEFKWADSYNPLGLDFDYVYKHGNAAKEFIKTEIQAMPSSLRECMKDIVEEDFSLSIDISLETSSNSAHIVLNPHEVEEALKRNTDIDSQTMSLMLIAKGEKMLLPAQVDSLTNWTDILLNEDCFLYIYEVDDSNIDLNSIDKVQLKKQMGELYANPQKSMLKQIEKCINTGRSIGYKYIGTHTNKTLIVQLLPHELKAIIHKTSNSTLFMGSNKHTGD